MDIYTWLSDTVKHSPLCDTVARNEPGIPDIHKGAKHFIYPDHRSCIVCDTGGVYINNLKSDIGFSSLGSTLQTDRKIMINSQGFFIFFARKNGVKDKKSLTFIFLKHIIKEKDEK